MSSTTAGRWSLASWRSRVIPKPFRRFRVEFDGEAAYQALKDSKKCLPEEPERVQIDGLVAELGQHIRVW